MKYRLSRAAERDLDEIADYTAENWGLAQAENYVGRIFAMMEALADNPGIGRSISGYRAGYRYKPVGSHSIFYRESAGVIEVVRVLHQRMDPDLHIRR